MSEKLVFDYYYGKEADQFSFFRIPKMLFTDHHFSALSSDAKILYGLMLDRMSLSIKNEWQDEDGRTYIIYTIENIMEDLGCSKPTAIKTLQELDSSPKGIGLVEKVRKGLGKPDVIYVKNFVGVKIIEAVENSDVETKAENPCNSTEVKNLYFKKSNNFTSRGQKSLPQEVKDVDFKKSNDFTPRSKNLLLQEVKKADSNYIDNNNPDLNQTEFIQTEENCPIHINPSREKSAQEIEDGRMDEITTIRDFIMDHMDYNSLLLNYPYDRDNIDEMVDLLVEAIASKKPTIRINGEEIPRELARNRFSKINYTHVEYVMGCLKKNTTKVRNIRSYLLTSLYNAPATINSYYQAEVNHDMYGDK